MLVYLSVKRLNETCFSRAVGHLYTESGGVVTVICCNDLSFTYLDNPEMIIKMHCKVSSKHVFV